MKKVLLLMTLVAMISMNIYGANSKVLVTYFTRTNNTEKIAQMIQEKTGGDIFKVEVANPYPDEYRATTEQAKKELAEGYLPPLKSKKEDIQEYDVIFVGHPIWWGTVPASMRTFLTENNLKGKVVIPFSTHGGGGAGTSVADMTALLPDSKVETNGFTTRRANATSTERELDQWLNQMKAKYSF